MTQMVEEEVDKEPPVSLIMNESINPQLILSQRREILNEISKPDWIQGEEAPMLRPTWVRR